MTTTITIPADGTITWIGDAHHKGADIYWSERRRQWVIVDLENREVEFADRIAIYSSTLDGDETGLNQTCVACDLDGRAGLWVVPLDADDVAEPETEGIELEWESAIA